MNRQVIDENVSVLYADTHSIQILAGEVGQEQEVNSPNYFKLHAVYQIAENMRRLLDEIEESMKDQ